MNCIECGERMLNVYRNDEKSKFCPNKYCDRFLYSTLKYTLSNPT